MYKINKKFVAITISGIIFVSLILFFSVKSTSEKTLEIKVAKVNLRDIKQIISSTGSIGPETRVKISSKIKEKIVDLNFKDDKEYVFVVNYNRLHKKEVKSGIKSEDFAEIISGIEVGQTCVKSSATKLKDGSRIKIVE